jgi:hypothetical protein
LNNEGTYTKPRTGWYSQAGVTEGIPQPWALVYEEEKLEWAQMIEVARGLQYVWPQKASKAIGKRDTRCP